MARLINCDLKSLEGAAKFFGLDYGNALHRALLGAILADAIFGKHKAGRRSGDRPEWNDDKLVLLGRRASELEMKNPKLRDPQIADLLCKQREFKPYKDNPETIRKKLKEARGAFEHRKRVLAGYRQWARYEREVAKDLKKYKDADPDRYKTNLSK
jgi:hypothetical protein